MVLEPPYEISETGYACFEMKIEVFFRNREKPKSIVFDYDLFLELGRPVNKVRREKLTIQNPPEDFLLKLLAGGAVSLLRPL